MLRTPLLCCLLLAGCATYELKAPEPGEGD